MAKKKWSERDEWDKELYYIVRTTIALLLFLALIAIIMFVLGGSL